MASMAEDIVFAVNMPPHEPAPGQAWRSTSSSSAALMRFAEYCPGFEGADDRQILATVVAGLDRAAIKKTKDV